MVSDGARANTTSVTRLPILTTVSAFAWVIGLATSTACSPFTSTNEADAGEGPDAATNDGDGATRPPLLDASADSTDEAATGFVCTERASMSFPTLAACAAAAAPTASDCASPDAGEPTTGAPCRGPTTWCRCEESSTGGGVQLRARECVCNR